MMRLTTLQALGEYLVLFETQYANNGRVAYLLQTTAGEPWCDVTVNLPEVQLGDGQFAVKTWGEQQMMREPLLSSGVFRDTGRRVPAGFAQAEVWTLATPR